VVARYGGGWVARTGLRGRLGEAGPAGLCHAGVLIEVEDRAPIDRALLPWLRVPAVQPAIGQKDRGEADDQRDAAVAGGQRQAFAHADLVIVLVQNAQVEGQQRVDDADEGESDPGGIAQDVGREEGDQGVHRKASSDRRDQRRRELHRSAPMIRSVRGYRTLVWRRKRGRATAQYGDQSTAHQAQDDDQGATDSPNRPDRHRQPARQGGCLVESGFNGRT